MPPLCLLATLIAASTGLALLRADPSVTVLGGPAGWPGLVPAVLLAALSVGGWLVLRSAVVRPIQRLRDDLTADVRQVGSMPGRGRVVVRRSIISEVDRVAAAHRGRNSAPHRLIPLGPVLLMVTVGLAGALCATYLAVSASRHTDSQAVQAETAQSAGTSADRIRASLLGGLSLLQGNSSLPVAEADLQPRLNGILATRVTFRSVYVVDGTGTVVARAGQAPQAGAAVAQLGGLNQMNIAGSTPTVVATEPLIDGTSTLVGEFDPRVLNDMLRQVNADSVVVDSDLRTLLSNRGYQAFSELEDPSLRSAAGTATPHIARSVPTATIRTVGGRDAAVVATGLGDRDPVAALGWTIVTTRDLDGAAFAHDAAGRAAAVIAGLGTGAVLAMSIWTYLVTLRPLRHSARLAEAVRAAGRGAGPVPGPAPIQRIDEVGAINDALNRRLQKLSRASVDQPTVSIPAIPSTRTSSVDDRPVCAADADTVIMAAV